jgi:hypothetical protein
MYCAMRGYRLIPSSLRPTSLPLLEMPVSTPLRLRATFTQSLLSFTRFSLAKVHVRLNHSVVETAPNAGTSKNN